MYNLHSINSRLTNLKANESSKLVTNFNIVLRFEQLEEFRTYSLAHWSCQQWHSEKLKELKYFCFRESNEHVSHCSQSQR